MEEKKITKEMLIGDIVNKYPETAVIFLNHGLHCVGCAVNPYETIHNGCLGHGMSEEEIDKMVEEMNEAISKTKDRKDKIISVTDKAAEKFKEAMTKEGKGGHGVRFMAHGGCCKLEYSLEFASGPNKTEEVIEDHGLRFFIEKGIVSMIKGTVIDYFEDEQGKGFKIENPNVSCCHE